MRHHQRVHNTARARIPCRRATARRTERGDVVAPLPADREEDPAGVDRRMRHGQRVHQAAGVRIPRCRTARREAERGQIAAHPPTDRGDLPADVKRGPPDRQRIHAGVANRTTRLWVPAGRPAGPRADRGDQVARPTADRSELTTGVHSRPGHRQRIYRRIGARIPGRIDTVVCPDMRQVHSRNITDLLERAADVIASTPIGSHRENAPVDLREPRHRRPASHAQRYARAGVRPDVAKRTADIDDIAGRHHRRHRPIEVPRRARNRAGHRRLRRAGKHKQPSQADHPHGQPESAHSPPPHDPSPPNS